MTRICFVSKIVVKPTVEVLESQKEVQFCIVGRRKGVSEIRSMSVISVKYSRPDDATRVLNFVAKELTFFIS